MSIIVETNRGNSTQHTQQWRGAETKAAFIGGEATGGGGLIVCGDTEILHCPSNTLGPDGLRQSAIIRRHLAGAVRWRGCFLKQTPSREANNVFERPERIPACRRTSLLLPFVS